MGPGPLVRQDLGNGDAGPDGGAVVVDPEAPEFPDHIHDDLGIQARQTGFSHGDLHLGFPVEMPQVDGDESVHEGVLGLVDPGVLLGIGGENGPKFRVDLQVAVSAPGHLGQIEDLLLQDAQEGVVGLGPGPGKLIVNESVAVLAGHGETVVHPGDIHGLFGLEDGMDVVVDESLFAVAGVAPHQIGTGEFVVPVDQYHRTAPLRRHMKGQGGFARAGRTGEVDRITHRQVGQGALAEVLDITRFHEFRAGFRGHLVVPGLHLNHGHHGPFPLLTTHAHCSLNRRWNCPWKPGAGWVI